ncbi:MAG: rod shape-determining protein MreD [Methylococcaceae bacterium]|nr:rod shape-determining protein MreD [Methylococcaceae bacterium]
MNKTLWFYQVTLTIVVAMCLRILPLSHTLELFNPDWVLLALIYWSLVLPERVGIFYAWAVGLLTDELTGQLFGQHALAYSLAIYACLKLHKRLRQYSLLQQGFFIFCCLLLSQLLFFFIKNLHQSVQLSSDFWLPLLTGTACWPLVYTALRFLRSAEQANIDHR